VNTSSPQVWWRRPGESVVKRFQMDAAGDMIFRYAPFQDADQFPIVELRGHAEACEFPKEGSVKGLREGEVNDIRKDQHIEGIHQALKEIEEGTFEKVVLSRSEFWQTSRSPEALFRSKCHAYPHAFVYLLSHPNAGVWLGATPELLLHQSDESYRTVSLAGTKAESDDKWTEKERREQHLVTDFIEQILRANEATGIQVGEVHDRAYGHLRHLETNICFRSASPPEQLLSVLHPTPAVGGNPREAALQFIEANEAAPRGYYAGYLGLIQSESSDFYVNLRCMQCYTNGYRVFAGGGIVQGSKPEDEWQETQVKIDSIRTKLTS